ncbi:MAG: hypothetical protein VCA55_01840 [Verrucomicrobiales bacterium]
MHRNPPLENILTTAFVILVTSAGVHAQGDLAPPTGAPAPTMKSLQEIWERIGQLESKVLSLQEENAYNLELLLSALGGSLPWQLTTVDSG